MVKRRRNGSVIFEDEKRNDDGTSSTNQSEGNNNEHAADIGSPPLPTISLKNRIHVTRTVTKETQNAPETNESETAKSLEKNPKIVSGSRSSNRAPKRIRKEPSEAQLKKSVVALKQNAPLASKTRRPWEVWSVEDKNAFFEALCEFGKDFENIQSYIAQRGKKKGISANMIKNKDQVRHFYYRTWHKIAKFLVITDEVRKQTQEIYGLINYAELRKKIGGCLNGKNRQKLNELVFNGVTTVKYKGKRLRIKTPVCRALKKLTNVAESKEPETEKLPKDIVLEFRPKTNDAWLHVQNLAQNPRVRTKTLLQRRLKSVIEYLQHKWKPFRLKKKEQVLSSFSQLDFSFLKDDSPPLLIVKPKDHVTLTSLSISSVDSASSADVCLVKHLEVSRENLLEKDTTKLKKNSKLKKVETEIITGEHGNKSDQQSFFSKVTESNTKVVDKDCGRGSPVDSATLNVLTPPDSSAENAFGEAQRSFSFLTSMLNPVNNENKPSETHIELKTEVSTKEINTAPCTSIQDILNKGKEGEKLTLGQLLSLGSSKKPSSPEPDRTIENTKKNVETPNVACEKDLVKSENNNDIVGEGWTVNNVGLLTVGELYLMLGKPSKIVLEYEFQEAHSFTTNNVLTTLPFAEFTSNQSTFTEFGTSHKNGVAETMKKLVQVALNTFSDFKNKQNPLSPTLRAAGHSRVNNALLSSTKPNSRCTAKNSGVKNAIKAKSSKLLPEIPVSHIDGGRVSVFKNEEMCTSTNVLTADGIPMQNDKHVFVVPVGTAPRPVKKSTQDNLKEELDKLLPGTRRGCRVRRKPLVVQRPLLPLPSTTQMTLVVPPQFTTIIPDNKQNMLPSEKVVKLISGPSIDVRPLQVPIMNQLRPKEVSHEVILQQSAIPTHLLMTPVTSQSRLEPLSTTITLTASASLLTDVSTIISNIDKSTPMTLTSTTIASAPQPQVISSAKNIIQCNPSISTTCSSSGIWDKITSSPPILSLTDMSFSSPLKLSPNTVSFLSDNIPVKPTASSDNSILDFSESSTLSAFDLQTKTLISEELSTVLPWCHSAGGGVNASENTPPQSPPGRPFRINSPGPDAQWLNGESGEFSLNTLLNTLESPSKILSVSSNSLIMGSENSNLESISSLAPVMDSQVRCLLDEGSVDFIAKFENLADVINATHDSKLS